MNLIDHINPNYLLLFMLKPVIVISAINLRNGGTFSILHDCLTFLDANLADQYRIIALVHKKNFFTNFRNITFIEFPLSVKSYLFRIYYEYFYFKSISRKLNPHIWLSLHDITPVVNAEVKAVYCHNPSPFYKFSLKDIFSFKFFIFNIFYNYVYKINIRSNSFVIVQQDWLRKEFHSRFNILLDKIIVAYPILDGDFTINKVNSEYRSVVTFFYPSFPRVFKNFEVICEAVKAIGKIDKPFEVIFTIDGTENLYSRWIYRKYRNLKPIRFIGLQKRETIYKIYEQVDCLVFPSKLETYGLPLSEFKIFQKPILAANLPYARETIGNYDKVSFFNPTDYLTLSKLMNEIINGTIKFQGNTAVHPNEPFAKNWSELFNILLKK